jgi:selenocysteine lyase/cysteine desulfurase
MQCWTRRIAPWLIFTMRHLRKEIVFGNNMTTITLHLSRSLAREWKEGDEIVVTRLDHDANVTPWVLAAQDRGVQRQLGRL